MPVDSCDSGGCDQWNSSVQGREMRPRGVETMPFVLHNVDGAIISLLQKGGGA